MFKPLAIFCILFAVCSLAYGQNQQSGEGGQSGQDDQSSQGVLSTVLGESGESQQQGGQSGESQQQGGESQQQGGESQQQGGQSGESQQQGGQSGESQQQGGQSGESQQQGGQSGESQQQGGQSGESQQQGGQSGESQQQSGQSGESQQQSGESDQSGSDGSSTSSENSGSNESGGSSGSSGSSESNEDSTDLATASDDNENSSGGLSGLITLPFRVASTLATPITAPIGFLMSTAYSMISDIFSPFIDLMSLAFSPIRGIGDLFGDALGGAESLVGIGDSSGGDQGTLSGASDIGTLSRRRRMAIMDSLMVLIEGKWRIRRCCCFDLRTGTTILGILDFFGGIIAFLTLITCFDENGRTVRGPLWAEYFREAFPFSISTVMKGIFCTIYAIIIVSAVGLLYGNLKGITRTMYPWIWVELANIVIFTLGYFVKMIEYFNYGHSAAGFQALFQVVGVPIVGLLLVQVVRCRMVEIEERDRPAIPFTQVYPNAPPAYGQTKTEEE